MNVKDYVEVSKPRIVIVLVITAVTSLLAASRFDDTPGWHVTAWQLCFLALAGALSSMGSSAINHYYDRDMDKIMSRTSNRPIPSGRLCPRNVLAYGLGMCILSVILASLTLNPVATSMIAVGIFSMLSFILYGLNVTTQQIL